MKVFANTPLQKTTCYHCGDACAHSKIALEEKVFCCQGCKSVYEILSQNNLCDYYAMNQHPGIEAKVEIRKDKFQFLEDEAIQKKLLQFDSKDQSQITFYLPQIHCSSCLWLLEQIRVINAGIIDTRVNFNLKELFVSFDKNKTNLRAVVETLTSIGYEPHLSMNEISERDMHQIDRQRWYKIGIAGFCFANIMMISVAQYFAIVNTIEPIIKSFFHILSVALSLPVLFYAASEFFVSAYHGIKNKFLNIDFPVAMALVITFTRSLYELYYGLGDGYLDSMAGIVFFMLIGRWLQSRTYQTLSFNRDYKSFFPIALNVIKDNKVIPTEIFRIQRNDIIQVHHNEIIPMDAILSKGSAKIDYSFVSGENEPISIQIGEMIYAGGKQLGGIAELLVIKEVSQSYLTNLWNNPIFSKKETPKSTIYDAIGKYFTYVVLAIGFAAGLYWYFQGQNTLMWNALTTVLIVACPCALLLSHNFTNGNILRIFAKNKFYLRSADVLEKMTRINHLVFDKTGTITQANASRVSYAGNVINDSMNVAISSLAKQSSHPSSTLIVSYLNCDESIEVVDFKETTGMGIEGWVDEHHIKIGSSNFVGGSFNAEVNKTKVVVYIDGEIFGDFIISNKYRLGISKLLSKLKDQFSLSLLSGDNNGEEENVEVLIGKDSDILFHQSPQQKMDYIVDLQKNQHLNVMMIGDGLNDAGALKQSDVGIAVADAKNTFTPSSDAIIDASRLVWLDRYIHFAQLGKRIILFTFCISAIYNVIGLYFAIQGTLSPVIAAILMPASSLSIIFLTYGLTDWVARVKHFKN
ncbi:MAG: heavy metal translocating P-type ATPase metal-binding domain-containing protein [Chitinophagales bacterium]|nr:heavy metal translocating P-type ATPase metal-binding domain-containing protein [Chitinophagales bacterium]